MKTEGADKAPETVTADEMRAIEGAAIGSGRVSGEALMERAGAGLAEAIRAWPEHADGGRVLVLCGPGNNGGDGYVVARLLAEEGWRVTVAGLGSVETMPPDAALNRRRWQALGRVHDLKEGLPEGPDPDVIVDALFGTGLARGIEGTLAKRLNEAEALGLACGARRVAVDLPSGIDTDSGRILGAVLPAHSTVTFHARKPAHVLRPDLCGTVSVVDIGL
ncbi:MAG: NAD(P)H-hydrate epimerase [Pseudomonadota bacterium]